MAKQKYFDVNLLTMNRHIEAHVAAVNLVGIPSCVKHRYWQNVNKFFFCTPRNTNVPAVRPGV